MHENIRLSNRSTNNFESANGERRCKFSTLAFSVVKWRAHKSRYDLHSSIVNRWMRGFVGSVTPGQGTSQMLLKAMLTSLPRINKV